MPDLTDAQRLTEAADIIAGAVDNGPWVLIADPQLRQVVGEYVADACHSIALAAGLGEAAEHAHDATPVRLDTVSRLVAPDARERLARHLWLDSRPDDPYAAAHWQAGDSFVNKEPWRRKADAALAVITGREG